MPSQPHLVVIAPELCPALTQLAEQNLAIWLPRGYQPGDLKGALLAFAATDDPATNRAVWREARRRRVAVNVADDPERCTFIVPAVLARDALTVAVSTAGASPALAALVRDEIARALGPEYGTLAMLLAELRTRAQRRYRDRGSREAALRRAASEGVLAAIRRGDLDEARATLAELVSGGEP